MTNVRWRASPQLIPSKEGAVKVCARVSPQWWSRIGGVTDFCVAPCGDVVGKLSVETDDV